jgi:hypothetical protein
MKLANFREDNPLLTLQVGHPRYGARPRVEEEDVAHSWFCLQLAAGQQQGDRAGALPGQCFVGAAR